MAEPSNLSPESLLRMLDDLWELGICLPRDEKERLIHSPPSDVDAFVDAIFAAEGLEAKFRGPLYRSVKDRVVKLFADAASF